MMVNGLLVKSFPDIVSTDFTAQMEEQLDQVEDGDGRLGASCSTGSTTPFKLDLEKAKIEMRDLKREEKPTDEVCEKCGKPMVIKWGRNGHFLACSGLSRVPQHQGVHAQRRRQPDGWCRRRARRIEVCPTCGAPMVIKRGRFGEFLACSKYPECKTTSPISLGVDCPKPGCGGYLTEKRSRRGKVFFGCSNYSKTKCDFVSWDRPLPQPCPKCGAKFVVQKVSKAGVAHPLHQRRAATTPPTRKRTSRRPRPRRRRPPADARRRRPHRHLAASRDARVDGDRSESSESAARTSVATASTCRVCGNMSNGCSAQAAVAGGAPACAMSRACVSGLHET